MSYYPAAQPVQSTAAWPNLSGLIPKVMLINNDGTDETYIEVTIEWAGRPWKTWRWQLKMKGNGIKLVALGEVYSHEAKQASVTPRPFDPTATTFAVESHANVASGWTALGVNDFHSSTYEVLPTTNAPESIWAEHNPDEEDHLYGGNYTTSQKSGGARQYNFPRDGGSWSTPRSFVVGNCDDNKGDQYAKSKSERKKKH